jgi:hypothetical protein
LSIAKEPEETKYFIIPFFLQIMLKFLRKFSNFAKGDQMNGEKKNEKSKEKRAHPRKNLVTKVNYRITMQSKGETLTQNISEKGLCLILDREIPPGVVLELRLDFPGKESNPLETRAEVVWQKKTAMGFITGLKFGV